MCWARDGKGEGAGAGAKVLPLFLRPWGVILAPLLHIRILILLLLLLVCRSGLWEMWKKSHSRICECPRLSNPPKRNPKDNSLESKKKKLPKKLIEIENWKGDYISGRRGGGCFSVTGLGIMGMGNTAQIAWQVVLICEIHLCTQNQECKWQRAWVVNI